MPASTITPLPPGTILQYMYLKERLSLLEPGRFVEIGCGEGRISKILLDRGWTGVGYDLNEKSLRQAEELNAQAVNDGRYVLRHTNWLHDADNTKADLILSSLVLEHLSDAEEAEYIEKCERLLNEHGTAMLFVPGSPEHWGIEDEVAGHFRRYTAQTLQSRFQSGKWQCAHVAGLTCPVSNLLLVVSNYLVQRAESNKLALNMQERTVLSSSRGVEFKTAFPPAFGLILNEVVMLPFHYLQKMNTGNGKALILMGEFKRTA